MFDNSGNVTFSEPVFGKIDPQHYTFEEINRYYRTFEICVVLFTVAEGET